MHKQSPKQAPRSRFPTPAATPKHARPPPASPQQAPLPPAHTHTPSALRADRMESISSMKMTEGCRQPATANSVFTIFSPSPIHLLVRLLALMLKKEALMLLAMAFPMRVLPVPGGPKSRMPLGGARGPCDGGFEAGWWLLESAC